MEVKPATSRLHGALGPGGPVIRLAAALGIALGLLSVFAHALEYRGAERFSKDFAIDYSSALALRHGEDPYLPIHDLVARYLHPPEEMLRHHILPGGNWHPPFKVAITVPFTYLSYRTAGVIWEILSAMCIALALAMFGRELGWSRRVAIVAGISACALPVAQIDLSAGQLNGPILLLLVLTWRSMRRSEGTRGGAWLGFAAALKFFPAFMALPLLAMGRRRAFAIAVVTTIVLTGAGLLAAGPATAGGHLGALRNEGFSYWETSPANLSWWGFASRWLTSNGWVSGADLPVASQALAIIGAGAFALLALRAPDGATGERFWAAVPLMLLAWPIVWNHYLLLAAPWVVLAVRRALDDGSRPRLVAVGVVSLVVVVGLPPGLAEINRASSTQVALGYQLPTLGLLAAVALGLFSGRRVPAGAVP